MCFNISAVTAVFTLYAQWFRIYPSAASHIHRFCHDGAFPLDGDPFLNHFKESIVNIILSAVQIKIPFSDVLAA